MAIHRLNVNDLQSWCSMSFNSTKANPMTYAKDIYINGANDFDLVLPEDVCAIGNNAFYNCKGLRSLTIKGKVKQIGMNCFYSCTNLSYIRLPKGLRTIYEYAFADCSSLRYLEIPNGVESIGKGCLLGCINLEELVVPYVGTEKNPQGPSRESLFGNLFGSTKRDSCTLTLQCYGTGSSSYEMFYIPNKLSKVVVTGNTNLYYAFYGCGNIKEIVLRDISYIGAKSFYNCSGLTNLALPESLTTIESYAFMGCTGLTSLTLPKSLTTIKGAVFYGCSGLTSVKLPENLSEIGERAFYGCSSLKKLEIPSDIESIGESCLGGCRSLEELVVPFVGTEKNPQGPSKNTLLGTLFGTSKYEECVETQQYFNAGGNPQTLTFYIPEKLSRVTVTGNSDLYYAFYNCCNLKEINLSNTCFIGEKTFYGCSGLTNLTLPESLTTIGAGAFAGCSALKSIVIPQKVSSLYQYAFSNCTGLKTVKLKTTRFLNNACTLGKIFENCVQEYVFDVDSLTTNAVYSISNLSRVTIGQSCTTIENNALYRATIDTLWISKDIAYVGNQNVTVRHFYYQGSEADWNRVVNKSELEPDEFGIPRILERDRVKYGI